MLNKILSRTPLHEHADPQQRLLGVAELPPDSAELLRLLHADPAPEVRAAAARRCSDAAALIARWSGDGEPLVRSAIVESLGHWLDGIADGESLRRALEGIGEQQLLVEIALAGAHAPVRMAAAERVSDPDALRRLAESAKDKDRGVARLARHRVEAIDRRAAQAVQADALLAQAEALVEQPGAVVMAAVELERRWKALDLRDDAERLARWDAAGAALQARFEREREQQRAQAEFDQRLADWLAGLVTTPAPEALPQLRAELQAWRARAEELHDAAAVAKLAQAEKSLAHWEQAAPALATAQSLVAEAERLAADTGIDNAQLPLRWQALELAVRTPELSRRFEAAIMLIESRRLAQMRATQQQESAARHQLHTLLHEAEQALAAGHVQAARAAADQTRALKAAAGTLPKPTIQRLSRVVQQLGELERWMSFGQHQARVQLCERAEALAAEAHPPAHLAKEVPKLRAEWKALDEQHAGVPKALWERFDAACEKAYAPAARHFAELHASRKQARKQRDEFIAAAAEKVPALLAEPHDLRAIERWLRETDQAWHGAGLGSVEPDTWKKLDARMKQALAPLRELIGQARSAAKAGRQALIAEAEALVARAQEREAPAQARALQARWQEQARAHPLAGRDERALWERFRAACNAVFESRDSKRKEIEERKRGERRVFEQVIEQLDALAQSTEPADERIRRSLRELQQKWKEAAAANAVPAALETRFRAARGAVEGLLSARSRGKEAAVWQALLAKAQLCDELDAALMADPPAPPDAEAVRGRWAAAAALAEAWEKKMAGRRDQALGAFADEDARYDHLDRIDAGVARRRDALLELELALGLPSPAELIKERLAVQVKQLRSRFKDTAATAGSAGEILLEWCATPGVADARDRGRVERIIESLQRRR